MVEINNVELYNLVNSINEKVVDLQIKLAVSNNTQEQARADMIQFKSDIKSEIAGMRKDINDMKQENAENKGEQNKSNYFKDKIMWPIIMLIIGLTISFVVGKLTTPPQLQIQPQNSQYQQIIPTPVVK